MSEQKTKQRHGCLTAWLILMIVANSAAALFYLFGTELMRRTFPNAPAWLFIFMALLGVFNLACAIALFKWKKWGFWGFCASSVVAFIVNLSIGVGVVSTIGGLLGVAILYGILQIGNEDKGWPQLE